jgi:hypothetical protein
LFFNDCFYSWLCRGRGSTIFFQAGIGEIATRPNPKLLGDPKPQTPISQPFGPTGRSFGYQFVWKSLKNFPVLILLQKIRKQFPLLNSLMLISLKKIYTADFIAKNYHVDLIEKFFLKL